ncbi:MAG: twin-arginine translocase subunit TatC, partial [Acidobacteriales bacterium]|nr:twin-arginine translocase subunit TatC [Terriglobales bacterium]
MAEVASSSAVGQPEDPTVEQSENELKGMSLLEHLEELRRRIIYAIISIAAGFAACWWLAPRIFNYMQKPITDVLRNHNLDTTLVYLNPTQPFNLYLKVGLMAGLFVASPIVLYQVWAFVAPGLYRNERRYVIPFMLSTVALFVGGGLFGYFIVYPAALNFLIETGGNFKPMITIADYMDLFMTVIVGLGIVFEMPILIFFLALMGVVSAGWLWRNLRYSILVMFIIAAILTPTTDIVNMCI